MENIKSAKQPKRVKDRTLPNYTKGEELLNSLSHFAGAIFGIAALVVCVALSVARDNTAGFVGSVIYGITVILLYGVSGAYHGLTNERAKKVMRIVDHCTIYLLIAGTYTIITLGAVLKVNPVAAYTMLAIEWGFAALATTLTAIDMKKYSIFSMVCYLVLGWCVVFFLKDTLAAIGWSGFAFLLAGGIAYTVGSVIYGLGKKRKYFHSVFHFFCLLGTILQFVCIVGWCI